jgi:NodT family efflux transporter outer membrane factor (OMF) lipoprotein
MLVLSACAVSPAYKAPTLQELPVAWQGGGVQQQVSSGWLKVFNDSRLEEMVAEAIGNNPDFSAQSAQVAQARQQLIISGAPRIPEISAAITSSKRRVQLPAAGTTFTNAELSLDLSWEIDIWGKLKDAQKQAALTLSAREAELEQVRQQLVAAVCNAWYDVLEAKRLLMLFESRLDNLERNLDIIEAGYRQGLNPALDVYLSRTSVKQEAARTSAQQQVVAESVRRLQILLGRYPDGRLNLQQTLPLVDGAVPAGLPSELIERRPDLRSAWLDLMAADVSVAVAHKQRFPHLSITGSVGQGSNELKNLLDANQGFWSLAGGLLQPLFNAGDLAAREEQSRARLMQLEQQYLSRVYQAFSEVESALAQESALEAQYQLYLEAEKNAVTAETLSFEQYQRGLVSYATVLESQRRAFDAQSAVVQLKRQQLSNRIVLYTALGGSFEGEES